MGMKIKEPEALVIEQEVTRKLPKSSVIERTAFWASLVVTVLLVAIALVVKLLGGVTSQALVIASIAGLVSTVLLSFRNRWMSLAATAIEGYLLYMIWTEPFVIDSLKNPKGGTGGIGHFIGDVLVVSGALLAVGCSLGTTTQQFRGGSRQVSRWYLAFVGVIIGLMIGALEIGILSTPPAAASGFTVANGVGTIHMNAHSFLQTSVTISKGDKLTFVDDSTEEHDLYNGTWQNGAPMAQQEPGAPVLNNVALKQDSYTAGPFATAGTYHVFCSLHKGMELTIIVQ